MTDPRPWYRHRSPWLLMLGPAVVVVAGLYTAWLAIDTDDGLVVEDYYREGKTINRVLKREEEAHRLGLAAEVRLEAAGHLARVRLQASAGVALPERIELRFSHPTRAGFDQTVVLNHEADGSYVGTLQPPGVANWYVLVEDTAGAWRLSGRWQSPAAGQVLQLEAAPAG